MVQGPPGGREDGALGLTCIYPGGVPASPRGMGATGSSGDSPGVHRIELRTACFEAYSLSLTTKSEEK